MGADLRIPPKPRFNPKTLSPNPRKPEAYPAKVPRTLHRYPEDPEYLVWRTGMLFFSKTQDAMAEDAEAASDAEEPGDMALEDGSDDREDGKAAGEANEDTPDVRPRNLEAVAGHNIHVSFTCE